VKNQFTGSLSILASTVLNRDRERHPPVV